MTDFEISKCIELGRKWPNHSTEGIIRCIRAEYGMNKKSKNKVVINKLEMVTRIVCNYFQEDIKDLLTKKRCGKLVKIRQICSLILYWDYEYSFQRIGNYLLRTHATILYSKNRASYFYDNEKQYKIDVTNCRDLIFLENIE